MCVKYVINSNIGLVAWSAHFEPEVIGSIPRLYTTEFFSLHP